MEDDLSGRQPQWKTTSLEDNLSGRQPPWKTASLENDLSGRRPQWKVTLIIIFFEKMEYGIHGRQHHN